jgi:DNA repair protein REV1
MFLGEAKKLCPNVIVLPYDFDGYEEVSSKASDIVHSYADRYNGRVEQVSCDEFYAEMMFPECG